MAYTTINKSSLHHETLLYTGDGNTDRAITVGFQPDMVWYKERGSTDYHTVIDSIRGATNRLYPNANEAQGANSESIKSFTSTGYTIGNNSGTNANTEKYCSWNWSAGGAAPTKTYTVKVVSDSGNKYRFDDFGTSAVTLDLQEGGTYTFDSSDSSVNSHPFVLGTSSGVDGSYDTGVTYKLDGVTKTYSQYTSGFSSATSRQLIITVAGSAPTLYYNCSVHSGMGGSINTNSTFGSSDFSGTIQSTVSVNTAAGFSIVKWTGTASNGTIGHGLGAVPEMAWIKNYSSTGGGGEHWLVYHKDIGNTHGVFLNLTNAKDDQDTYFQDTTPSSSVMTIGTNDRINKSGDSYIGYFFTPKTGYSRMGVYTGNGDADGVFVYTGFKPTFLLCKMTGAEGGSTDDWRLFAKQLNSRDSVSNETDLNFKSHDAVAESAVNMDLLSNGFKIRTTTNGLNQVNKTYIYIAIGQTLVGSNNVPATAR